MIQTDSKKKQHFSNNYSNKNENNASWNNFSLRYLYLSIKYTECYTFS